MYRSILASALITLSASSASAFGWGNLINEGVAANNTFGNWWAHYQAVRDMLNYNANYELEQRKLGSTHYVSDTLAHLKKVHGQGFTGTGVNVLIKDQFRGAGSHGETVENIFSEFAPGATIERHNGTDVYAVSDRYNDIINQSFGHITDAPNRDDDWRTSATIEQQKQQLRVYTDATVNDLNSLADLDAARADRQQDFFTGLFVTAAGNDGTDCLSLTTCNLAALNKYTANATQIVVGSINDAGNDLTWYSQQGGLLKNDFIAAPAIRGCSGTSCSTPLVTATAALIMDKFGTDAEATKQRILLTADDLGAPGVDNKFGHGRLNTSAALSPIGALR